jgi:endonuclease/exonuclease/phosphatase family metal-dependent hydrolase
MVPTRSLRMCLRDRGIDPNNGIRSAMFSASVPSVRVLCGVRVMAWNIYEGELGLDAIVETMRALRPDIALLNEVSNPLVGTDQTDYLALRLSLFHRKYENTTIHGGGTKGVAVLSRYPLLQTAYHPVVLEDRDTTFGTLQATILIDGLYHEVFTTRFRTLHAMWNPNGTLNPHWAQDQEQQNQAGHEQALNMVQAVPADRAVIFGGDFNANWQGHPWAAAFRDTSGLNEVIAQYPQNSMVPAQGYSATDTGPSCDVPQGGLVNVDPGRRYDYLYYRGPYSVALAEMRCKPSYLEASGSDHPYVYAVLARTA